MADNRYLLKVLTGIYQESELPLEYGEYILGHSLECDINIEDATLSGPEIKIMVSEEGVRIEKLNADRSMSYQGVYTELSEFVVDVYQPINLEGFCFAIGLEGEEWPDIDLNEKQVEPELDTIEVSQEGEEAESEEIAEFSEAMLLEDGVSEEHEVLNEEVTQSEDDFNINPTQEIQEFTDNHGGLSETVREENEHKPVDPASSGGNKKNKINLYTKIAGLVFIIGVIGIISVSFYQGLQDQKKQTKQIVLSDEEIIRKIIKEKKLKKVKVVSSLENPNLPKIIGYVTTDKMFGDLVSELARNRVQYEMDVYIDEHMLSAGYSLLNAFSFRGVELGIGRRPGTIVAKGYIENLDKWNKIKAVIGRDIEGLKLLVDEVDTPARRLEKLNEILLDMDLESEVKLFLSDEGIIFARTSLSTSNEPKWQIVEDAYKKSFGDQPRLVTLVDKRNWINIKSVNLGAEPYLVLADGRKYVEGALMDNDYIVEKINEDGVILKGKYGIRVMPLRLKE